MADFLIILVLALILGGAGGYVWRAKKAGRKCIGCPESKTCSGNCSGCTSACSNKK